MTAADTQERGLLLGVMLLRWRGSECGAHVGPACLVLCSPPAAPGRAGPHAAPRSPLRPVSHVAPGDERHPRGVTHRSAASLSGPAVLCHVTPASLWGHTGVRTPKSPVPPRICVRSKRGYGAGLSHLGGIWAVLATRLRPHGFLQGSAARAHAAPRNGSPTRCLREVGQKRSPGLCWLMALEQVRGRARLTCLWPGGCTCPVCEGEEP